MKKGIILGLMILMALAFSAPANAVIAVDDWTLDLTGVDGLGPTVINNISEITYVGLVHTQGFDTNGNGTADPGEYAEADGLLAATSFVNTNGQVILGSNLNNTYEMTFGFSVDTIVIAVDPITGDVTFVHAAADDPNATSVGLLEIFVDGPTGGINQATQSTGDGYLDGEPIALFAVLAGDGGVFHPLTFDGSDDASFVLLAALPGVILDSNGNDIGVPGALLALTDSNTDADPTHDPNIGFTITTPTMWPFGFSGAGTALSNFAEEDGSARIAPIGVFEPSTILLLGMGLLGLGAFSRKRMKK